LFVHAAANTEVLNDARKILEKKLIRFAEGHPERVRKERALERVTLAINKM
jgi:hypothetical protein